MNKVTNYDRWSDLGNHSVSWDSRTEIMAGLIPKDASVFEFGAGRQVLKNYLRANKKYTASDIVIRDEDTFVCDLNDRPLPSFPPHDIAVFSGVLEYINELHVVIRHLRNYFPTIIASYAVTERNCSIQMRRNSGWVNDFSCDDFVNNFTKNGYVLDEETYVWNNQIIFVFKASGG